MKRKFIVFGLITAASLHGFSQGKADSLYRKKKIPRTDIQLLYSQYIQNGNHSAITGGIGTQKLLVYSPELTLTTKIDSTKSYSVNGGVDVITSASLDNIDYVVSSASRVSERIYADVSFEKTSIAKGVTLAPSVHISFESAYFSYGPGLNFDRVNKEKTTEISADVQAFFDDLRLGRFKNKPLRLVYPFELRYKQWFTDYRRQSYNLTFGIQQTINKRMVLGIFPGFSYQHGLLATPYHRVYFKDSSERVENLPADRYKIPIGIQLNSFIGNRYILQTYYRYYWDNFGIVAHSVDMSLGIKMTPSVTVTPLFRWHMQTACHYFEPYREHATTEIYYTSNYDLSAFTSYEGGLEVRFAGSGKTGPGTSFDGISFRYSYYRRTDGLYSHVLTLLTGLALQKKPHPLTSL